MTTRKAIKQTIVNEFPAATKAAGWYANTYYQFLKVKTQIKAKTSMDGDIITMRWERGEYRVKINDAIDRAILMPLLLN